MSDAIETLGKLIDDKQGRDAIHIAVAPVVATEKLFAGMDIGFTADGDNVNVGAGNALALVGIVDPFLKSTVHPGQRFWMFLYPRTITSLRHEWEHPAFAPQASQIAVAAAQRLREIAEEIDMEFHQMVEGARQYVVSDGYDYLVEGGRWEGTSLPEDFWANYQAYTGEVIPEEKRGRFFSCSC